MSFEGQACLGAHLLEGFVGFDFSKTHPIFKRAENFYNIPTCGVLEYQLGTETKRHAITTYSPQIFHNLNNSIEPGQERNMLETADKVAGLAGNIF